MSIKNRVSSHLIAAVIAGLLTMGASAQDIDRKAGGDPGGWCRTFERWVAKNPPPEGGACPIQGNCDIPEIRDTWIPDPATPVLTLRMKFIVFAEDDGSNPAATQDDVNAQLDRLNADMLPSYLRFAAETEFVNSTEFRFLSPSEAFSMKSAHADAPETQLNVFVTDTGGLAWGVFPWDPDATTFLGGIVIDEGAFGPGRSILTHEVGHNVGLWHTHHGVDEVDPCSACYERADGLDVDTTGDYAGDTAPTPTNFVCSPPGGIDPCSDTPWGETDFHNYMGYAPDLCRTHFSDQQKGREQCWFDAVLTGWLCGSSLGCDNGVCEPSLGEDCLSCPSDCNGKQNGNPNNRFCCGDGDGQNPVDCSDPRCTSNGFDCSDLPVLSTCCGDGICEGTEDASNCAIDCAPPPSGPWVTETVDTPGNVGLYTSLALDEFANPHISYWDGTNGDAKYAKWTGSVWSVETIPDPFDGVGRWSSLALNGAANVHVIYFDLVGASSGGLRYARLIDSVWSIETVDDNSGTWNSIVLDTGGNPHVSYRSFAGGGLKYAQKTGSQWVTEAVDPSNGAAVFGSSIALDGAGNPRIAYHDIDKGNLQYAAWTGAAWQIETVDVEAGGDVGDYCSLALDASGNPHIGYYDLNNAWLKYARWTGSLWQIEVVDNQGAVGEHTSLALDGAGNPHISYFDRTNSALKYAQWTGSEWLIEEVDNGTAVGQYTSLVLDDSDSPHISYFDSTNGDLKYARKPGPALCVVPGDCDDADPCTIDDCLGGVCFNDPFDCDDGDACTADSCSGGVCFNDPIIPCCGDALCDPGEDECNCPGDCGDPPISEANCDDGIDNDCDGVTDCDDTDCAADPACQPTGCGSNGDPCTDDSDCCSNKCKNGTCRGN